jgi:hypothetical protein
MTWQQEDEHLDVVEDEDDQHGVLNLHALR